MEHTTHRPGTDRCCTECQHLVYEPGWYAALVAFVTDDMAIVQREPALSD